MFQPDYIGMTGNNWENINCGFRDIDDYGSGIHQFRALRVISHATSKVVFASACAFVRFGTLTTARHAYHSSARLPQLGTLTTAPLAKYDGTGRNSTPFLFAFRHTPIALDASYLLSSTLRQNLHRHPHRHRTRRVASYCTSSHCHLESCANNLTKNVHLLAASYSRLSLRPVSSSPPSSSKPYSSRPTDAIHAAGILIDIVLIVSYCTTSHCHLESCTNNLTKHVDLLAASFSRLSLRPASSSPPSSSTSYSSRPTDAIHAAGILIDIVLFASYCTTSHCHLVSCANNLTKHVGLLAASFRDCPCGRHHPHRHSLRHRTRRVVLYNFPLSLRELR